MNRIVRKVLKTIFGNHFYDKCRYGARRFWYKTNGTSNFCPCCNVHIKRWQSFKKYNWVDSYNEELFEPMNDKCNCPICDCAPRHRIEAYWLNNMECTGKKVLLWAPEYGLLKYFERKNIILTTADYYKEDVMCQENIEHTSFEDSRFDIIICNHVLEHVPDYKAALEDTFRILGDEGVALIMVPQNLKGNTIDDASIVSESERQRVYGQSDHLRLFGVDFPDILSSAGFEVEVYSGEEQCGEEILPIVAPASFDSNILYICRKTIIH